MCVCVCVCVFVCECVCERSDIRMHMHCVYMSITYLVGNETVTQFDTGTDRGCRSNPSNDAVKGYTLTCD